MASHPPFLDTNILIRHLTADHAQQSPECHKLIQALEDGAISAWTTHLVVAEVVFVLQGNYYSLGRQEITDLVLPLIDLPGLRIPQKRVFHRVFEIYTQHTLGWVDCYHAALVEQNRPSHLISYDQGFDQISSLQRLDPTSVLEK